MDDNVTTGIRLEEGALLPQTVEKAAAAMDVSFCDVTGFGELSWVDLEGPSGESLRFDGPLVLVHFKGRLRAVGEVVLRDYVCTISRHTDNGVQVLGGKLLRAQVEFMEVSITPLEPPPGYAIEAPEPQKPAKSVEKLVSDSSLPDPPAPTPESDTNEDLNGRWTKAIDESNKMLKKAKEDGYDFDTVETRPKTGDFVNHRQFGKCKVVRIGDSHITLRKPDKRNVQLGLAILEFTPEGEEDGHGVFRVEVKTKR